MKAKPNKPWDEFRKFHTSDEFFGCVDKDGVWFDSSISFDIAVHWCVMYLDSHKATGDLEEEIAFMNRHDFSVVHSSMLKKMYEAGLIK